jgi:hypothetical protein
MTMSMPVRTSINTMNTLIAAQNAREANARQAKAERKKQMEHSIHQDHDHDMVQSPREDDESQKSAKDAVMRGRLQSEGAYKDNPRPPEKDNRP